MTFFLFSKIQLRSIGSTIAVVLLCFFAFFVMKAYPLLLEAIGIHGTLWISSAVCAVGVVIIVFLVPETKGKNLVVEEQQQESEANKTRTNAF